MGYGDVPDLAILRHLMKAMVFSKSERYANRLLLTS
jgi:hypothetical protein